MTRIIAIANQKGGSGKTALSVNLSTALGELGKRVLLIDLDPQANTTAAAGIDPYQRENPPPTIYDLLLNAHPDPNEAVRSTHIPNVDLIPSSLRLDDADIQLPNTIGGDQILSGLIERLPTYDYILIDTRPSLGRLTQNALSAAHQILIPIDLKSSDALFGTERLFQAIDLTRQRLNPGLSVLGVVCTFFDGRTSLSKELLAQIQMAYPDLTFKAVIPTATKVGEAATARTSVLLYAKTSTAAAAYREVAKEVMDRAA